MSEIWKPILGYEKYYSISNKGRVKSLNRKVMGLSNGKKCLHTVNEKILSDRVANTGYKVVCLTRENNPKTYSVHRLVATAFIENPLNKPCVNHLDGIKKNNNVYNLQWCTYSENEQYSYRKLGKKPNCTNLGKLGYLAKDFKFVAMFDYSGELKAIFHGANEAARAMKVDTPVIAFACRNEKATSCDGHVFRYFSKEKFMRYKHLICDSFKNKKVV